jgi:hypothetical protein
LTKTQEARGFELLRQSNRKSVRESLVVNVQGHISRLLASPSLTSSGLPSLEQERALQELAALVACGRTPMQGTWVGRVNESGDSRNVYEQSPGDREAPFRVYQQLKTLLLSLALVNERQGPTEHELSIVTRVALSSVLLPRAEVLEVLARDPVRHGEECGLTVGHVARALRISDDAARNRLDELVAVGLLVMGTGGIEGLRAGRPAGYYCPAPQFRVLLLGALASTNEEGELGS